MAEQKEDSAQQGYNNESRMDEQAAGVESNGGLRDAAGQACMKGRQLTCRV